MYRTERSVHVIRLLPTRRGSALVEQISWWSLNSWPLVSAGECLCQSSQQDSSPAPFQAPCHHSPSLLANKPSICFKKIPEITVCGKNSTHPPFPPRLELTPSSYLYPPRATPPTLPGILLWLLFICPYCESLPLYPLLLPFQHAQE